MTGDVKGRIEVFRFLGYENSYIDADLEKKKLYKTLDLNNKKNNKN